MSSSGSPRGFTFVELLTLLVLAAIATTLLIPVLAHTKTNSATAHCVNNL